MARRALPVGLAAVLALGLLVTAPAAAQDSVPSAPPERQDTVMGTGGGSVSTGRDPVTGDTVLRATPQEQPRPQYEIPVVVQPEITVPAPGPKPRPASKP